MSCVGSSQVSNTGTGTTATLSSSLTPPGGGATVPILAGDILYMGIQGGGGTSNTFTWPTGFNSITGLAPQGVTGDSTMEIRRKVATGSEPSTYNIVSSANDYQSALLVAYRNRNQSTPETAIAITTTSYSGNSPEAYSLTGVSSAANDDVFIFICNKYYDGTNAVTFTPVTANGYTDARTVYANTQYSPVITSCDLINVSSGTTGTAPGTITVTGATNLGYAAFIISIAASPSVTLALTGSSIATSLGSLSKTISPIATGSAIATTLGTFTKSTSTALAGKSIATTLGNIVSAINMTLSGRSATFVSGTITASTGVTVALTGMSIVSAVGTISPFNISSPMSGTSIGTTAGSLSPLNQISALGSSIVSTPGLLVPTNTQSFNGSGLTSSLGFISPSLSLDTSLTGQSISSATGTLTNSLAVSLNGSPIYSTTGFVTSGSNVNAALTGISLSSVTGSLASSNVLNIAGSSIAITTGVLIPTFGMSVSGLSIVSASGNLNVAYTLSLTGRSIATTLGIVSSTRSSQTLTGSLFTSAAGSIAPTNAILAIGALLSASAGNLLASNVLSVVGQNVVTNLGGLNSSTVLALFGAGVSFSVGSVSASGGTGGNLTLVLSGLSVTSSLGNLKPASMLNLAGTPIAVSTGSLGLVTSLALSGNLAILSEGYVNVASTTYNLFGGFQSPAFQTNFQTTPIITDLGPSVITFLPASSKNQCTELSDYYFTISYFDVFGVAVVPISAQWRIWDDTNKVQLQDWTPYTPSGLTDVMHINEIYNALGNPNSLVEQRQVTFKIVSSGGNQRYESAFYSVIGLEDAP